MAVRKHATHRVSRKPAKYGSPLHRKRISESLRAHHKSGKSSRKNWYWIQKMDLKKGALHRALHVPIGQRIPKSKLAKATHSRNSHVRHMAAVARTLEGLHHKKAAYRTKLARVKRHRRARAR